MKKLSLFTLLCLMIIAVNAQSFKTIEKEFKYVRLPLKMLPGTVKTFNYEFTPGSYNWAAYPYDRESMYSFVRLGGYQFQKANSDVTISLAISDLRVTGSSIKSQELGTGSKYWAVYEVTVPTTIKITDNSNKVLDEITINDKIDVTYPPATDQFGMPIQDVKNEAVIKETMTKKADFIDGYVKEVAYNKAIYTAQSTIQSSYSFVPIIKKYEIMSFKTKKDADFTAWESNAQKLAEALDKLSGGASPQEFSALVDASITFWKSELAKHETNMKENKQLVGAAAYNIVLASIFANKFDVFTEMATKFKAHSWKFDEEFGTLIEMGNSVKKRAEANTDKTLDYKTLGQIPPLKINQVEAQLTPKGGKPLDGIIDFGDPFYVKPYQNSEAITFIPREAFLASMGNVKGKDKKTYKPEDVEGYKVAGREFVGTEYSDPTTFSLSGNKALLELLISGKAKLYIRYERPADAGTQVVGVSVGEAVYKTNMDSKANPSFIISVGKKSVIIFNYSAFSDLLKDCPTVVEKLTKGEYGNPPIEQKTGKFAKMMSKGKTDKIDMKAIVLAITEYNSLMK